MAENSERYGRYSGPSNDVREQDLDLVDRILIEELEVNARIPNNALAAAAGIAPSTSHGRVRSLLERGVIRGFHAAVDPAAVGRGLQAMISIQLQANARSNLTAFMDQLSALPQVQSIFFLTGDQDFLIHVAVADSRELRDLVADHLSVLPQVAGTSTSVIFEHLKPPRTRAR